MAKEKQLLLPMILTISRGDEELEKHYIYNLLDDQYQTTFIPVLRDKRVIGSSLGWLILLDLSEDNCCLWNPTSMEIIELFQFKFQWEEAEDFNRCILSKPPNDPDCFIVFNQSSYTKQKFCRIGDGATFDVNSDKTGYLVLSMISFQGVIYGIIQPPHGQEPSHIGTAFEFVSFHREGEKLEKTCLCEITQPIPNWAARNINYLIESPCGNELLLVTQLFATLSFASDVYFRVFRIDLDKMECEELDSLNGQTIFISYYGNGNGNGFWGCSESFGTAVKPNSIYYITDEETFHIYDFDDRSTISLCPDVYRDADINTLRSRMLWVDPNILNNAIFEGKAK